MKRRRMAALACGVFLLVPVFAAQVQEDPLEREVLEISRGLRCAVCQNQPISESDADLARDMRAIIREQVKAGKSREDIVQYFVDRYGNYVLMQPPVTGPGTLLWAMPALLAAVLGLAALAYLKLRRRETPPTAPKLSKQDLDRVRRARADIES